MFRFVGLLMNWSKELDNILKWVSKVMFTLAKQEEEPNEELLFFHTSSIIY